MRELRNKSNPTTLIPWETQAQAISESFLRVVGECFRPLESLGSRRWEATNRQQFPHVEELWLCPSYGRCRLQRHSNSGGNGVGALPAALRLHGLVDGAPPLDSAFGAPQTRV
jgi:hypothetical protein